MKILSMNKKLSNELQGTIKATNHKIELKEKTRTVRHQHYHAGQRSREVLCVHIDKHPGASVFETAQSGRNILKELISKKDRTLQSCLSSQRLNAATIPITYPLIRMNDCVESYGEAKVLAGLKAQ